MKKTVVDQPLQADPDLLSVIIPAYNCPTIDRDLLGIQKYLEELSRPYEIICVVDGLNSAKDETADLAKSVRGPRIKVFYYPENRGKGYAVRYGAGIRPIDVVPTRMQSVLIGCVPPFSQKRNTKLDIL